MRTFGGGTQEPPQVKEQEGVEMAIYKRGKFYWYKFMWNGELIRESTKQGNQNVARNMESAHRTSLAKGEVGIRERKAVPTVAEFISQRFEPWAESSTSAKTWLDYYRPGIRTIRAYKPLSNLRLDEITSEKAADFAAWRQSAGLQVSSVNSSLQVLRRIMRLAAEWGAIDVAPSIKMLPGERHREHVVTFDEEARYLAAAPEPLASVAAVLIDSGMRPDECYRLRWESVNWANGRNGTILVTHGKTAAARRVLPLSLRARNILQNRWEAAGRPTEGWLWSAPTRSEHFEKSTLKKQHKKALRTSRVRPFVLYSLRHTFLTRLGESGCDAWTLARIAGHSSVAMSARYVHPSEDAVLAALDKLSGHNFGHSGRNALKGATDKPRLSASND
jgi:integrase